MNKREAIDIAFLIGVVVILAASIVYINLLDDDESEEADDEGADGSTEETGYAIGFFYAEGPVVQDDSTDTSTILLQS